MPSMTLTCSICNLPMQKTRTSKPQGKAAHNKCRASVGGLRAHGRSGYRGGCRCDVCRQGQVAAVREYESRRKSEDGVGATAQWKRVRRGIDPLATVDCFLCREPLEYVRSEQVRYPLHKACRAAAPEWIRRGRDNPRRAAFQAKIEKTARGTSGGGRVFIVGGCSWCGEYVTALGRYCSDKCKTSAGLKKRSSGNTFKISPKKRREIYVRDGWTCQLCTHPVSPDEHYLSDFAASLDHIIPQALQIIPDHSPENLRLVHRWCNSSRGDGSNMSDAEFLRRVAVKFAGRESAFREVAA